MQLNAKKKPGQSFQEIFQQDLDEDSFPVSSTPNNKTHNVAYMVINKDDMCTSYTDLTGRFPCKSSRGNEYLLIAYHYNGNCIIGHPLKNRKKEIITAAWTYLHNQFSKAGVAPNTYVMDNEISQELIAAMLHNNTQYQLVPLHIHRRNLAERAIQTYKYHLKSGLASFDTEFPLT